MSIRATAFVSLNYCQFGGIVSPVYGRSAVTAFSCLFDSVDAIVNGMSTRIHLSDENRQFESGYDVHRPSEPIEAAQQSGPVQRRSEFRRRPLYWLH